MTNCCKRPIERRSRDGESRSGEKRPIRFPGSNFGNMIGSARSEDLTARARGLSLISTTYSDVPCRWRARRPLASRVVILQLGSVRQRQRHNPLAYMMYIYSRLSLQCIIGRFSNTAGFGCFVSGGRLCCSVLVHISRDKSKTGQD